MPRKHIRARHGLWYAAALAAFGSIITAPAAAADTLPAPLAKAMAELETAWTAAPLAFSKGLFVDGPVSGFGGYTPRENTSFTPDDTLTVYLQPVSYGYAETDMGYAISLRADYQVSNVSGQILAEQMGFATLEQISRNKQREFHATLTFQFEGLRPGDYTLTTQLTDDTSSKSASLDLPFTISEPKPETAE